MQQPVGIIIIIMLSIRSHSINVNGPAPCWGGRKMEHCSIVLATTDPCLHKRAPHNSTAVRSMRMFVDCYHPEGPLPTNSNILNAASGRPLLT
jgi:hypothetical protein